MFLRGVEERTIEYFLPMIGERSISFLNVKEDGAVRRSIVHRG